jgi:hypothetical protein
LAESKDLPKPIKIPYDLTKNKSKITKAFKKLMNANYKTRNIRNLQLSKNSAKKKQNAHTR